MQPNACLLNFYNCQDKA